MIQPRALWIIQLHCQRPDKGKQTRYYVCVCVCVCVWFLSNNLTDRRDKQNDSKKCARACVYECTHIYFFFTAQEALVGQRILTVHI